MRTATIIEVRCDHGMTGGAQYLDDVANAASWFPNDPRQGFDLEQCVHCDGGSIIAITTPFFQRRAIHLARVIKHGIAAFMILRPSTMPTPKAPPHTGTTLRGAIRHRHPASSSQSTFLF